MNTNNIVNIADSASPLRLVLERRAQIKHRIEEIARQRANLSAEERALYDENKGLAAAEDALKKLLERR